MNTIVIENFKAFHNQATLKTEGKNILICGENGSGKTSLFEAFRFAYHREMLYNKLYDSSTLAEERRARKADFIGNYNNALEQAKQFTIRIDGVDSLSFSPIDEVVYCVSREKIVNRDILRLEDILRAIDMPDRDIDAFVDTWQVAILDEVNNHLKKDFRENISISVLSDGSQRLQINDLTRKFGKYEKLSNYFNEAKLNLVVLLLMLSSVYIQIMQDDSKHHVLVCDDLITSLDMTNRHMMVKYIESTFPKVQKIIFTHNVSFFNLFQFVIKNTYNDGANWDYFSMYAMEKEHYIYKFDEYTVESIRQEIRSNTDPIKIGNKIRRRLEQLLIEFSRLYTCDISLHSTESILTDLINNKDIYARREGSRTLYADFLVREIEGLLKSAPPQVLKKRINKKINDYREVNKELKPLIPSLMDIQVMKKLLLHPLSHGAYTYPTYSVKEETIVLDLLQKLEDIVTKGREINNGSGNVSEF